MKKRRLHKPHKTARAVRLTRKPSESYFVVVRSWMLVVVFAIMLGIGAVVGTFLNNQLEQSSPQVAGVEIEAR